MRHHIMDNKVIITVASEIGGLYFIEFNPL